MGVNQFLVKKRKKKKETHDFDVRTLARPPHCVRACIDSFSCIPFLGRSYLRLNMRYSISVTLKWVHFP